VLALTNDAGAVQTTYRYDPFGNTTVTGTSTNPFQYTGRENDGTGLMFYRARYYSPTLQRFISEDPIEFFGGDVNLYAYVLNSPLNFIDPYGLAAILLPPQCQPAQGSRKDSRAQQFICDLDLTGLLPIGLVTTGFTKHGINQIINRGLLPKDILQALKNPIEIVKRVDDLGRTSYQYIGEKATIAINEAKKIITGW